MPTLRTYITGFALSILLTLTAFGLMWMHIHTRHVFPTHNELAAGFIALAILQLVVQLICFLHIGKKSPSANLAMLSFAIFIVFVVVGGTLWIMTNLNQNMQLNNVYLNGLITPQNEND